MLRTHSRLLCPALVTSQTPRASQRRHVGASSTCDRTEAGNHPNLQLSFLSKDGSDSNLLRAASYLRAHSFGTCPEDRSEYAKRAHMLMCATDALEQMEAGLGVSSGSTTPSDALHSPSIVAFCPVIAMLTRRELDGGELNDVETVIAGGVHVHVLNKDPNETAYVCGTLDVTVCSKLPSEELIGKQGQREDRAYLSNVCVLAPMRKRGIARRTIEGACAHALELGVRHMYVHVVEDNAAARKLYEEKCGFAVEAIESANVARGLNRPRRLLLHRSLM